MYTCGVQISYVWRRIAEIRHESGKDDIYEKPQKIKICSEHEKLETYIIKKPEAVAGCRAERHAFIKCWIRLNNGASVPLSRYGISDLCGSRQLGLAVQQDCEAVVANPATFTVLPQLSNRYKFF